MENPNGISKRYISCACSDFSHTIRVIKDDYDGTVWVEMMLVSKPDFWGRLKLAWQYLWGRRDGYGPTQYDQVMLTPADAEELAKTLREFTT